MNLLFICSRNQWRSPTAETIWRKEPGYAVRSAGTSPKARRTVTVDDLHWADVVFVMEKKHKNRLQAQFNRILSHTPIHVLYIEDNYHYMDPELVELLKSGISAILEQDEPE